LKRGSYCVLRGETVAASALAEHLQNNFLKNKRKLRAYGKGNELLAACDRTAMTEDDIAKAVYHASNKMTSSDSLCYRE